MCFVLLFERTRLVANTFFERHLDLHNTCHKEAADQYQILSANSFPVSSANVGHEQRFLSLPKKRTFFQPQIHSPLLTTPEALTIKAADEENHLRFPKPGNSPDQDSTATIFTWTTILKELYTVRVQWQYDYTFLYCLNIWLCGPNGLPAHPVVSFAAGVPEVFLACGGNFRCRPKADTSSALGRERNRKPR